MADLSVSGPIFSAVSSSPRQIYLLLRCISFTAKAQVKITAEGLRFSVEDTRVMEGTCSSAACVKRKLLTCLGMAFLNKSLFTTFQTNLPTSERDDSESEYPVFDISLPALLETLQIFGITDISKDKWNRDQYTSGATRGATTFDSRVLGMTGMCRLSYESAGMPLCIMIEEAGVKTTCELATYVPNAVDDIPFDRENVPARIIMGAAWLHDAVIELASTSPEKLTLTASATAPFLSLAASGPLGSAMVDFEREEGLLETLDVRNKITNGYKFALIKSASRAMAMASKVSIRADEQGVLSLQFMVEVEGGQVSFVEFRFVPLLDNSDGESDSSVAVSPANDGLIEGYFD